MSNGMSRCMVSFTASKTGYDMCLKLFLTSLAAMCFTGSAGSVRHEINLVKGKDTILIMNEEWRTDLIGLTTATDTIVYDHKDKTELGYEVHRIDEDSIIVKRPKVYRDTLIVYENNNYSFHLHGHRFKNHRRKDGLHYVTWLAVDEYEYRSFAYKDITSFQYPPKAHIIQSACIVCIIMPFTYPFLIRESSLRTIPRTYKIPDWKLFYVEIRDRY